MASRDRIAFTVHTAELINHFQSVWNHLPPDAVEVLVSAACSAAQRAEIYARCAEARVSVMEEAELVSRGIVYDQLVSNHPFAVSGHEAMFQRIARRNIRFMYAAGKAGWNSRPWNQLYDMILCFGPYHASQFEFCKSSLIVQMGYPRFDAFFNRAILRDEVIRAHGGDPERQTIVWLPTWKELCSIDLFAEAMSGLMDEYNVIVKVHPLTPAEDPARLDTLGKYKFTQVITTAEDNLPLYQIADFLVCDYGGPMFGAVYVDKNFLLLNVPHADKNEMLGQDSPDMRIRRSVTSIDPAQAHMIRRYLKNESVWEEQRKVRFAYRRALFAPFFGFASQVAALALTNADAMYAMSPRPISA